MGTNETLRGESVSQSQFAKVQGFVDVTMTQKSYVSFRVGEKVCFKQNIHIHNFTFLIFSTENLICT